MDAFFPKIEGQNHRGDELGGDGGDGGSPDAPVEDENVDGVQNGVEDGADDDAVHGHFRAAVGPDHVGEGHRQYAEWRADEDDGGIILGIGHHGILGAEGPEHGLQENQPQGHHDDTCQNGQDKQVVEGTARGLLVALAHLNGGVGTAAGTDHGRYGQHDGDHRESDGGGGIAQHAHTLTNEYLVHDVVDRVDQHGDHRGYGKCQQQLADGFIAQRVFSRSSHLLHLFRCHCSFSPPVPMPEWRSRRHGTPGP